MTNPVSAATTPPYLRPSPAPKPAPGIEQAGELDRSCSAVPDVRGGERDRRGPGGTAATTTAIDAWIAGRVSAAECAELAELICQMSLAKMDEMLAHLDSTIALQVPKAGHRQQPRYVFRRKSGALCRFRQALLPLRERARLRELADAQGALA